MFDVAHAWQEASHLRGITRVIVYMVQTAVEPVLQDHVEADPEPVDISSLPYNWLSLSLIPLSFLKLKLCFRQHRAYQSLRRSGSRRKMQLPRMLRTQMANLSQVQA